MADDDVIFVFPAAESDDNASKSSTVPSEASDEAVEMTPSNEILSNFHSTHTNDSTVTLPAAVEITLSNNVLLAQETLNDEEKDPENFAMCSVNTDIVNMTNNIIEVNDISKSNSQLENNEGDMSPTCSALSFQSRKNSLNHSPSSSLAGASQASLNDDDEDLKEENLKNDANKRRIPTTVVKSLSTGSILPSSTFQTRPLFDTKADNAGDESITDEHVVEVDTKDFGQRSFAEKQKRKSMVKITRNRRASAKRREKKLQDLVDSISDQRRDRTRFMHIITSKNQPWWLQYWVMLLLVLTIFLCSSVPFRLAFGNPTLHGPVWIILLIIDILLELVFIFDIFLNFHLSFLDDRGVEVSNPPLIKDRYVKSWLFVDIIAVLPLDMGVTQIGSILRVLKMLRVFHVMEKLGTLEHDGGLQAAAIKAVKLSFSMFLVFHIVGCIWFSFASFGEFGSTIFVPEESFQDSSGLNQYMQSLFWALSLLSNTSIPKGSPTNKGEALFTVLSMTAGMGVISYVVGSVGAWMEQRGHNHRIHDERLRDVLKFLHFNEVDMFLKKQVTNYLSFKWVANRGFDSEQMFSRLPLSLRSVLSTSLAKSIIEKVPFFSLLNEDALSAVLRKLQPTLLVPGQYVFRKGDAATTMYFIRMGEVEAISHSEHFSFDRSDEDNEIHTNAVENVLAPNSFGMVCTLLDTTYSYSARSKSFADIFMLLKSDMFAALDMHPEERTLLDTNIEFNRKILIKDNQKKSTEKSGGMAGFSRRSGTARGTAEPTHDFFNGNSITMKRPKHIVGQLYLKPKGTETSHGHTHRFKMQGKARSRVRISLSQRSTSILLRGPRLSGKKNENSTSSEASAPIAVGFKQYLREIVLFPNSRFGRIWSRLMTLLNFYNVLIIPFRIVFVPRLAAVPLLIADYVGDVMYIIDIYVNFHLAFPRAGHFVSTLPDIQDHYYSTTFWRHAIASIPLDFAMLFLGMMPLLRCLRLLRINDVYEVLFSDSSNSKTLFKKVGTLLLGFFFGAHFVACFYFTFTYFEGYAEPEDSWLPPSSLQTINDPMHNYLYSLYFSYNILLRLGVGIVPTSILEVLFTIVVLLCGVLVVAQLIASFSAFLQVYDMGESRFKRNLTQLDAFLVENAVPGAVHSRVIDFYRFEWNDLKGINLNTVLHCLPSKLRHDVLVNICLPALRRVKTLSKLSENFLHELSYGMKFTYISQGEVVYTEESNADSMYFVRRGRVDLRLDLGFDEKGRHAGTSLHAVILPGRHFGEELLKFEQWREMAAIAEENTHMLQLETKHFFSILEKFPDIRTTLRENAAKEKE